MAVCLVTQQLRNVRSGVGTYARQLLAGLRARGIECRVALLDGERPEPAEFPGTLYIPLGQRRWLDPTPGAFWSLSRAFASAWRARAAWREGVRLVHFLDAREAAHFVRTRPEVPTLGTVHDDYAVAAPRGVRAFLGRSGDPLRRWAWYAWLRRLENRVLPRLHLLLANSEAVLASHRRAHPLPELGAEVIPYGLEAPPEGAAVPLRGDPAVLFIGGNFFRKGLHVLVRACALLRARLPHLRLHVVGADPNAAAIRRLARAAGIEQQVELHGWLPRPETLARLRGATCLAVPSLTEGFGLVYLEAMQLGIPAIGGDVGGTRELIQNGSNGILVPPGDAVHLAEALWRMARDSGLRRCLAHGGRETAARYRPEAMVERTLDAYARVLTRNGDPASVAAGRGQLLPVKSSSSAMSRSAQAVTENARS
jgi:glycosyltransferase involved in cell wall biosynthesis